MTLKLRILKRITLVMCMLAISNQLLSQTTLGDYSFDSNSEGWVDGGSYASYTGSTSYYCNSPGAIFIHYSYDFDTTSSFTSPTYNLNGYSLVEFSFCMTSINVDNGEGFDLQYTHNNGNNWSTIKEYRRGVDFDNNNAAPNGTTFTVSISNCDYNFNPNSKFRFIGKSSWINEFIIFDDIQVVAYTGPDMNIIGGTDQIVSGDTTPTNTDNTYFGIIDVFSSLSNSFTIENLASFGIH